MVTKTFVCNGSVAQGISLWGDDKEENEKHAVFGPAGQENRF